MIVSRESFESQIARFLPAGTYALDCESTGLRPYHGDRLFSLILGDETGSAYFNFLEYPGLDPSLILPKEWLKKFQPILQNRHSKFFLQNAKFDLALLAAEGLHVSAEIHCTQAIARVIENDRLSYSLDTLAGAIGLRKSQVVDSHISEMGLWEWETIPGKKSRRKRPFFFRVPFEIISEYGVQDGVVTYAVGKHQEKRLEEMVKSVPENKPSPHDIARNEKRLTQTLFKMEQVGIQIDVEYCKKAVEFETARYEKASREFKELSDLEFRDSPKSLEKAFIQAGESYPRTEKGNPTFSDEVLQGFTTPLANLVRNYRDAYKRCNSYYRNFIYHADDSGIVHASINPGGAATGRMSVVDPALQTLNKEEEDLSHPYLVRRAFVPRPGYFFFMIDYNQMEYRLMLDYAQEREVIQKILEGLDVHEATAQMMGVSRQQAKTLNFMLLYGGGAQKLADALGIRLDEAQTLKRLYFSKLPGVQRLIRNVMATAEQRGYIFNWAGRICQFPDKTFAYKAPNYLIQGGCADVVKIAMNRIDEFLSQKRTRMLVQIHDEILFEGVEEEKGLIPEIQKIMESVYPYKHLPLTCSVSHSSKSWADKVDGLPS